ncbi:hypothetical protein Mapa_000576 [Marchantia paleacea]|nr:hypothetical protein Mapa_000576 [Marchantia paleacea]
MGREDVWESCACCTPEPFVNRSQLICFDTIWTGLSSGHCSLDWTGVIEVRTEEGSLSEVIGILKELYYEMIAVVQEGGRKEQIQREAKRGRVSEAVS